MQSNWQLKQYLTNTIQQSRLITDETINRNKQRSLHSSLAKNKTRKTQSNLSETRKQSFYNSIESMSYVKDYEDILRLSIGSDMNNYIMKRIKTETKKKEETLPNRQDNLNIMDRIQQQYELQRERNIPKNYLNIKISNLLQSVSIQQNANSRVIAEPFIMHYKQKLRRMIQKKKQAQSKFNQIKNRISNQINKQQLGYVKNNRFSIAGTQNIKKVGNDLRASIEQQLKYQQKRYKKRLQKIHSRYTINH